MHLGLLLMFTVSFTSAFVANWLYDEWLIRQKRYDLMRKAKLEQINPQTEEIVTEEKPSD